MFAIRPMEKHRQIVELEIGLAPASAADSEIENGPLHIATPTAPAARKNVWATVQATGRRNMEAADTRRELSPALGFQTRVRAGLEATGAYGQNSIVPPAYLRLPRARQVSPNPHSDNAGGNLFLGPAAALELA